MFNFLGGAAIVAAGAIIAIKSEWMLENFGRIEWFEVNMASNGGTRLGYKLIGMGIIFIGTLIMTGLIGDFLGWILSPLLRYSKM